MEDFCENLLDSTYGVNFNYNPNYPVDPNMGIPTVPITPGQVDVVSPMMSYGPMPSYGAVPYNQQGGEQYIIGGARSSAEMGGATQEILSEASPAVMFDPLVGMNRTSLDSDSTFHPKQYNFKVTVAKDENGASGRGKQFKFDEKANMLYVKPKKGVPFHFTTTEPLPARCRIRSRVVFAADAVAKRCGPVRRCANHMSEDMRSGQLPNVEHFMQCRMEGAVYFTMGGHYCVSVPYDRLADGVCLFSFACYNSCLEYKDDSCRKAKLVKPSLQVLFTILDDNEMILGEDSIDLRVCACPIRDAPLNRCHGNSRKATNSTGSTCTKLKRPSGSKHHQIRKKRYHVQKKRQSLQAVVQQVQESESLDNEDTVDEKAGLYKFTCVARTKEQYQLLCTLRAAFQQQHQ